MLKPGARLTSRCQPVVSGKSRRRRVRLICRLLKKQRRALAKDVALASNEPQPILQLIAFRLPINSHR